MGAQVPGRLVQPATTERRFRNPADTSLPSTSTPARDTVAAMSERDDLRLLEAWANGDADAAETLLERHVDSVGSFFRTETSGDVDDLVQETFTRCLALRRGLEPGSSFRAYLFAVARNLLYAHYRKDARAPVDALEVSVADLDPSPSVVVGKKRDERILVEALRRIPLDSQVVLELYYWEELSVDELARALEVPPGTVKSRLHRAREQLRNRLRSIEEDAERLETTLTDLDGWARRLKPRT
jgi:RNA polymerase sigma-70 factor (ECF subfamily)